MHKIHYMVEGGSHYIQHKSS